MTTLDIPTTPTSLIRSRSLRNDNSAAETDNLQQQQSSTSSPVLANLNNTNNCDLNTANNNTNNNNNKSNASDSRGHHHLDNVVASNNNERILNTSSSSSSSSDDNLNDDVDVCDSSGAGSDSSINASTGPSASSSHLVASSVELDATQILSQSPLFRKKFETDEAKSQPRTPEMINTSSSLGSRLAALQKSQEDGWKQRVNKDSKDVNSNVTTRRKTGNSGKPRPVSLMDRVNQLESSSLTWKARVTQSDATKFTVAHKLAMSASASSVGAHPSPPCKGMVPVLPCLVLSNPKTRSASSHTLSSSIPTASVAMSSPPSSGGSSGMHTPTTPLGTSPPVTINIIGSEELHASIERKVRKTPQPKIFKSKTGGNLPQVLPQFPPSVELRPPRTLDYRRAISTPAAQGPSDLSESSQTVELFEVADENFHSFFAQSSVTSNVTSSQSTDAPFLDMQDLDMVTSNVQILKVQRHRVQKMSRHRASAGNPMKVLASKGLTQYTEQRLHAGERELRRNKVEELSKHSSMALEALAGLASKENFSAVTLKPVTSQDTRELPPYTHPMLLRIKGRRHAEARLVQPVPDSVNAGDDFVLVTPTQVYHYKSEFANVIERAKASEIAAFIVQQKDLGVTSSAPVVEINENVKGMRRTRFWEVLGGDSNTESSAADTGGDDEEMETCLAGSNKVYRVEGSTLLPHDMAWGKPPTVAVLTPEQVLVFDFGSEVYSWSGKRAAHEERKAAVQLARELWDESYDYTDCDVNPVVPVPHNTSMKGDRPKWGILGKITENLETILFKEKFIDWPDTAQQTRIKEVKEELNRRVDPVCGLQPCSGEQLMTTLPPEPDLLLEMTHLGRGTEYYDAEERRLLVISTKEYRVWHTCEAGKSLLSSSSRSHFHASDTYVVRWHYIITATGRTLKGAPSKHAVTGRERVVYFFWQGRDSSLSDKGASALMTVELDEERGPQIRVTMGSEPPAFLNLFDGSFTIHDGKRATADDESNASSCGSWKMYLVRGEQENEAHLLCIPVNRAHLRSRGCMLLFNLISSVIHIWHGSKALKHTRKIASHTAKHLSESSAVDVGWKSSTIPRIKEQFEGTETKDFWEGMREGESLNSQTINTDTDYNKALFESLSKHKIPIKHFKHLSLLNDTSNKYDWSPRMWRLEAKHDSFEASEVLCSYRFPEVPNPMPFTQEDLYSALIQPGLFLLNASGEVWLWQGWWPSEECSEINGNENNNNISNGSGSSETTHNSTDGLSNGSNDTAAAATTGSALIRFNFARKAALQTAINYSNNLGTKAKGEPQLVVAGLEPLEFTNLFPVWNYRQDVAALQRKGGRYTSTGQYSASKVLAELSRSHYSLQELQQHPIPDGVDPSRLEDYLSDQDFLTIVGMTRKEFAGLQHWKQLDLKKKANLF